QTRRAKLIDKLLYDEKYTEKGPTYASNWANIWTVWLMTRSGSQLHRDQMSLWLANRFDEKDSRFDKIVTDLLTATGKTNDVGAVNFILAHLGEAVPGNKQRQEGQFEAVPITSRTTRLFLGLQIQCTQCHDHPFNNQWKQQHFWGVNAYF